MKANSKEEYKKFYIWVTTEINPERIKDKLSPLTDEEILECFDILERFSNSFK